MRITIEKDTLAQIQDAQTRLDQAKHDLAYHKLQLKQLRANKKLAKTDAAQIIRNRFSAFRVDEEATGFGYCFNVLNYRGSLVSDFFKFTGMEGTASRFTIPSQPGLVVYLQP